MQELAEAITKATTDADMEKVLQRAAQKWATFCLAVHRDGCLQKGLAISAAIVDYLAERESPS